MKTIIYTSLAKARQAYRASHAETLRQAQDEGEVAGDLPAESGIPAGSERDADDADAVDEPQDEEK